MKSIFVFALALMVMLVALPVMASACAACDGETGWTAAHVSPVTIADGFAIGSGELIAAGAAGCCATHKALSYTDMLITDGGMGDIADDIARLSSRKILTSEGTVATITPCARDRPGLSGGHASIMI